MKQFDLKSIIQTERCIITMPELGDAQEIYDLIDDDVIKYMAWSKDTVEKTQENIEKCRYQAQSFETWEAAVYLKSGELIGRFGLHHIDMILQSAQLGYFVGKQYWGKGYIPECIEAFKKEYFEYLEYNKLIIKFNKGNTNSKKVAEKCGFHYDGTLRADAFEKGEFVDKVYYSFLKSDYERKGKNSIN